jgi:hypothetical protein
LPCSGITAENRPFNSTNAPFKSANALTPTAVAASATARLTAYIEAPPAGDFDCDLEANFPCGHNTFQGPLSVIRPSRSRSRS